jgi:hypothetical protein
VLFVAFVVNHPELTMTQTGKTLVIVNLVLSLVFVAWAIGLVTNQTPWPTLDAGDGPKIEGMVAKLQTEIKRLTDARNSADVRWGDAYVELQNVEKLRADAQVFQAALLRSVRTGDAVVRSGNRDVKIDPPVQQLEFGPTGLLLLQPNGRPAVKIGDRDALSLAGYDTLIQQTLVGIEKAEADERRLLAETDALTKQINGVPVPPGRDATLAEKGLRVQIRERQERIHNLRLEQEYLRSPLTYYTLQREQLRQRQAALAARLGELGAEVTARRD